MVSVDLLVDLESLIEKVHASVTTCNHKLPFDLLWLDLTRSFEVKDSFLKHVLLCVMHTETRYNINLRRVVTV